MRFEAFVVNKFTEISRKISCRSFELKLDISEMYTFSTLWVQFRGVILFGLHHIVLHFSMSVTLETWSTDLSHFMLNVPLGSILG
jgi:hypothetical protein